MPSSGDLERVRLRRSGGRSAASSSRMPPEAIGELRHSSASAARSREQVDEVTRNWRGAAPDGDERRVPSVDPEACRCPVSTEAWRRNDCSVPAPDALSSLPQAASAAKQARTKACIMPRGVSLQSSRARTSSRCPTRLIQRLQRFEPGDRTRRHDGCGENAGRDHRGGSREPTGPTTILSPCLPRNGRRVEALQLARRRFASIPDNAGRTTGSARHAVGTERSARGRVALPARARARRLRSAPLCESRAQPDATGPHRRIRGGISREPIASRPADANPRALVEAARSQRRSRGRGAPARRGRGRLFAGRESTCCARNTSRGRAGMRKRSRSSTAAPALNGDARLERGRLLERIGRYEEAWARLRRRQAQARGRRRAASPTMRTGVERSIARWSASSIAREHRAAAARRDCAATFRSRFSSWVRRARARH